MSAPRAWVLNLDVEHELEDPKGYTRSRAMHEQLRAAADKLRASGFLGAGDFVLPTAKGAGKKHLNTEALRDKVRMVLADPSYTRNAKNMSEKMLTYGGAPGATDIIENFIQAL